MTTRKDYTRPLDIKHGRVDMGAIVRDFPHRGTREHAASGPGMPGADRLIVGIEEVAELRVEELIAVEVRGEQKIFEEPGGVGQMPLRGTRVGHGLDYLVLRCEPFREPFSQRPNLAESLRHQLPPAGAAGPVCGTC